MIPSFTSAALASPCASVVNGLFYNVSVTLQCPCIIITARSSLLLRSQSPGTCNVTGLCHTSLQPWPPKRDKHFISMSSYQIRECPRTNTLDPASPGSWIPYCSQQDSSFIVLAQLHINPLSQRLQSPSCDNCSHYQKCNHNYYELCRMWPTENKARSTEPSNHGTDNLLLKKTTD